MRRQHPPELKAKIVLQALREEKTIAQLATEYEVHPNQIHRWKATALEGLAGLFARENQAQADKAAYEQQIEQLYQEIGKLTTHLTWLKKKSGLEPPAR